MLYELLTGQMPFDAGKLSSSSFDGLRQIIREQEPPKPSTRVGTLDLNTREEIARQRQTDYAKLRSALRGDIDWIVMRRCERRSRSVNRFCHRSIPTWRERAVSSVDTPRHNVSGPGFLLRAFVVNFPGFAPVRA